MHYKILVIKPVGVKLEDVMYNYEELDKTQEGIMNDDRGVFVNYIHEKDAPLLLEKIYEYYQKKVETYNEQLKYRATHSLEEFQEKYDQQSVVFRYYKDCCDVLQEYWEIKDLPIDNPKLIKFIKHNSFNIKMNNHSYLICDCYIKGVGYGYFTNPNAIWDYYTVLEDNSDFGFLSKINDNDCNYCLLNDMDIKRTLDKFPDPYQYIIFCKKEANDCKLYTMDDYSFDESTGLVENTDDSLREIYKKYSETLCYDVSVVDIHI